MMGLRQVQQIPSIRARDISNIVTETATARQLGGHYLSFHTVRRLL